MVVDYSLPTVNWSTVCPKYRNVGNLIQPKLEVRDFRLQNISHYTILQKVLPMQRKN